MKRRVLLLEPPYKNKYPPMGLMKLATYFKNCGDDVRFFKGSLKDLALDLFCSEFISQIDIKNFAEYINSFRQYIKTGQASFIESIPDFCDLRRENLLMQYRRRFRARDYTKFDVIAITTLFTFCWKETITTINESKNFLAESGRLLVGGIAASLVPEEIKRETGITPICGTLNKAGIIDKDNPEIIDSLALDYSILDEIDYIYPSSDAYFAYMTRGCIRNCPFCAVPILEPEYKNFISISSQINLINQKFGEKRDLLLMDNNVLASSKFNEIIDEIKLCGFSRGAMYTPTSDYDIAIKNLRENYNIRAYTRKIINLYDTLREKLTGQELENFNNYRGENGLIYPESASVNAILESDKYFRPLFAKFFRPRQRARYVDFNQGIDARLINDSNMAKLAEINIRPLRIAFDHYEQRDIYIRAVKIAVKHGIKSLSNYILYNFNDKPEELYYRLLINIDLCEELNADIYSFPMKYHPVRDPKYFRNRDYIGKFWTKKFIRAVQAVINATKGKIGRGREFFYEAFGQNINEFYEILYMPETFIIYREKYKSSLTEQWRKEFYSLNQEQLNEAKSIIESNNFAENIINNASCDEIKNLLRYYLIERD